ncbi:hypothetical protein M9H77_21070 [Catharanthus roseus]|uniref:Uncharacterized protein n=1 Tax=Catharanthus roseus TaxID=4058 RepID=A0ACC0AMS1_CATRO|nr:hypothetical protein M9H77_21070 [Catharanthus roseus]
MQEALPYKTWLQMPYNYHNNASSSVLLVKSGNNTKRDFKNMVKENAVMVFGKRGCCMNHVVKRLLQGLGVNPPVYEVDEKDENEVINELEMIMGSSGEDKTGRVQFPSVFIGGQLFGGLDRIIATHITGELTPVLKKAGALWL